MASGISTHIGLNSVDPEHYAGWSGKLASCEADAKSMLQIAEGMGYESGLLLTQQATRPAVIQCIENAARVLGKGDIFFLSFAGHGGQVPDFGEDEDDLMDETWCLQDGQILDDELASLWAEFDAGVRILVLSDSCHSGTATRALEDNEVEVDEQGRLIQTKTSEIEEPLVYRAMPPEICRETYKQNSKAYDRVAEWLPPKPAEVSARVRLISGCQDDQLSVDEIFHGRFTGRLLRVWAQGGFVGNYEEFHQAICEMMPPEQQPGHYVFGGANPAFDEQNPFTI